MKIIIIAIGCFVLGILSVIHWISKDIPEHNRF